MQNSTVVSLYRKFLGNPSLSTHDGDAQLHGWLFPWRDGFTVVTMEAHGQESCPPCIQIYKDPSAAASALADAFWLFTKAGGK